MRITQARMIIGLFFLMTLMVTGCAGPKSSTQLVSARQLQTSGYYKYWDARLPLREHDRVESAYLLDDNIYVTSQMGDLYCISGEQGLLRWTKTVSKPDYSIFPPRHMRTDSGDGPVIVVTTSRTFMFDRYSGEEIFAFTPEFSPGGPALGDGRYLYFGGLNGRFYSIIWTHAFAGGPIGKWELHTGAPVTAAPVLYGENQLIFATQKGAVVSCGAREKSSHWIARTEAGVVADPFVDETGVYVASTDRSLYRFDLATGSQKWRYRFPAPLNQAPVVVRSICYQACDKTGLTAIDGDTGEEKWSRADGAMFVSAGFGTTVIKTRHGAIDVVDSATGKTLQWFHAKDATHTICNTRDDRILLLTDDGDVLCARPETTPYLKLQQVRAAERTINSPRAQQNNNGKSFTQSAIQSGESEDLLRSPRDQ